MQGAEQPAKVLWSRPFLQSMKPLDQEAGRLIFAHIADSGHSQEEVGQILPVNCSPHDLLSLLSMLPDGLTDLDLVQSKLPLENILKSKTVWKSTALAYSDEHGRLKVLMPICKYLQKHQPPGDHLVQSCL
jgi:hypothetical protein